MLQERDVEFNQVAPGLAAFGVFNTSESAPPARPPGQGEFFDLGVAPGLCTWNLWRHDPGAEFPMHQIAPRGVV